MSSPRVPAGGPRERLLHVVAAGALEAARAARQVAWRPPSLECEGFVHLSFPSQLAGTLAAHFGGAGALLLVEVELAGPGLRLEPSRGGALFPHLYRALEWDELARAWPLARSEEGWGLPTFGATPALDDPVGRPVGGLVGGPPRGPHSGPG